MSKAVQVRKGGEVDISLGRRWGVAIALLAALSSCSQDPPSQPPPAIDCYDTASIQQMTRMMECVNELLSVDPDFRMRTCKWWVLGDGEKSERPPPTSEANCRDLSYANHEERLSDCLSGVKRPDVDVINKKCKRYVLGEGDHEGDPEWYIEHGGGTAKWIAEEILLKQEGDKT